VNAAEHNCDLIRREIVANRQSPVSKLMTFVPITDEVVDEAGWQRNSIAVRMEAPLNLVVANAFDRFVYPWKYADRAAMPAIDIFPWLTHWTNRARAVVSVPRRVRRRIRDVVDVCRHGLPEHDEDRW
jgi:hypothetical protein